MVEPEQAGGDAGDRSAGGDPAGPSNPLEALLRVQDLDTSLAQLEHRRATLAERQELHAAQGAAATLEARAAQLEAQRRDLLLRQAELEEQVEAISSRRQALQDRLYSDRGSSARDLKAMDDEIHQLTLRRAQVEDQELALMEEQEPVDAALAALATERAELQAVLGSLQGALAAAEAVVVAEITTLEQSRGIEAARLPTALADHYETLRARLGGVGAARLVGNRCEGCHLELPSAEVDRIRHLPPGTVVTCDQCGRILVRAAPAGAGG